MSDFNGTQCPNCGGADAERVKFTWWGGILGPKLLKIVKCTACGQAFNGKTGRTSTKAVVVYFSVMLLACGALGVAVGFMQ